MNKSSRPLGMLLRIAAILVCIAAATLPIHPSPVLADSAGTFGLRPAHPIPELPETASYFVYTIKPGESITDEAIAVNTGASSVRLNVFPAEGQTALNGGISYPGKDEPRKGTGNWVNLSVSDITLQPGQEQTFAFTVSVPAGTQPKQYVAGIILQNADLQLGSGTVGVNIVQRTATAILINVGGPLSENLEIEGVKANVSSPATTKTASAAPDTVTATLFNDSLSLVVPTDITIDVLDLDGNVTATIKAVGGTILPGDRIQVTALFPNRPKEGTYTFYAEAIYAKGKKIAVWPKLGTIIAPTDPPRVEATDPGGKRLETLPGRVELIVSPKKEDTLVTIPVVLPPGGTIASLTDSSAGLSLSGSILTIPMNSTSGSTGMEVVVELGEMASTDKGVVAKVLSVTIKSADAKLDLTTTRPAVGMLVAWAEEKVKNLEASDVIKFDIDPDVDSRSMSAMQSAASKSGLSVQDVAAILHTTESGVKNLFTMGTPRVVILVSGTWPEDKGLDNVRLVGITASGEAEVLETKVTRMADGRYRIEAVTPHGYASFGLIAVDPVAPSYALIIGAILLLCVIIVAGLFFFVILARRRRRRKPGPPQAVNPDSAVSASGESPTEHVAANKEETPQLPLSGKEDQQRPKRWRSR